MTTREEALEESMIGGSSKWKPYTLGRLKRLRQIGNPFFGGIPAEGDEWDLDRKMGTAWVMFTRDMPEIRSLMNLPNPIEAIDRIWDDEMPGAELKEIYDYIMREEGMTEAAQTEAIKERGGKSQSEQEGTSQTG